MVYQHPSHAVSGYRTNKTTQPHQQKLHLLNLTQNTMGKYSGYVTPAQVSRTLRAQGLQILCMDLKQSSIAMTARPYNLTLVISLMMLVASMSLPATANTLYQWTDKNGVITYSPTPPPESSGLTYEKVDLAAKPKAPDVPNSGAEMAKSISRAPVNSPVAPASGTQQTYTARSSVKNPKPGQTTSKAESHNENRCQDLANRVTALESRITLVDDAKALNQTILLLSRYQASFDKNCTP